MDILALDLGNKRVGVARAQERIAFPLDIVPRTSIVPYLKKYHQNTPIKTLVIGLPYDLYGKDNRQLERTRTFIKKLQNIFPDIQIVGHDERFSTFVVDAEIVGSKDAHAAQIILQSYLHRYQN